jgi:hypothetical protein
VCTHWPEEELASLNESDQFVVDRPLPPLGN